MDHEIPDPSLFKWDLWMFSLQKTSIFFLPSSIHLDTEKSTTAYETSKKPPFAG